MCFQWILQGTWAMRRARQKLHALVGLDLRTGVVDVPARGLLGAGGAACEPAVSRRNDCGGSNETVVTAARGVAASLFGQSGFWLFGHAPRNTEGANGRQLCCGPIPSDA
jgi:hypothetical protein